MESPMILWISHYFKESKYSFFQDRIGDRWIYTVYLYLYLVKDQAYNFRDDFPVETMRHDDTNRFGWMCSLWDIRLCITWKFYNKNAFMYSMLAFFINYTTDQIQFCSLHNVLIFKYISCTWLIFYKQDWCNESQRYNLSRLVPREKSFSLLKRFVFIFRLNYWRFQIPSYWLNKFWNFKEF